MNVAEAFVTLRPDMSKFEPSVRSYFRGRAAVFSAIGAAAVGAGAVAAVAKPAASLETRLNVLQAASKATNAEMEQMKTLARELGKDLELPATSASDAAEAMTELAKAGLSVNDVQGATRGVLQLSAAGNIENARAANIAGVALKAFGLEGREATRIADLLAAAANSSAVNVEDIADSLAMSATLAAGAKVPIEDVVTAIAAFGNAGLRGSDAGTSLKQMFLQLQAPSDRTRKVMEAINFSLYDQQGNMKDLRTVIGDLKTSTTGMTQEARDFALAQIFGSDAVRAANVILREGVDGFDRMKAAVTDEGAAAYLAQARTKGLEGAIDGLRSSISTTATDVGEKILPRLSELVRGMSGAVNNAHLLGPALREIGKGAVEGFGVAQTFALAFFETMTEYAPLAIAAALAVAAGIWAALGPAGIAAAAFVSLGLALVGFNTDWNTLFKSLPPPVKLALADVLDAMQSWAFEMNVGLNVVVAGINTVANAFIGLAKVGFGVQAGFAAAAGDFKKAAELAAQAQALEWNPIAGVKDLETTMRSTAHRFREEAEDAINQGRFDAFEKLAKQAADRARAGGASAEEQERRAEAARRTAEEIARATAGTGASLEDLLGAINDTGDSVESVVDRIKAAAERIEQQQTSDVVEAFFAAVIDGANPDEAIAKIRAEQAVADQVWSGLVAQLHDKLNIQVPDEFRGMWDDMVATSRKKKGDVLAEWESAFRARLQSVGRLPFNGLSPATAAAAGPVTNTYHITVPVAADAQGRVDTRGLVDSIVDATVKARRRDPLSEGR